MGALRTRIQVLTDHIHHIDPYVVIVPERMDISGEGTENDKTGVRQRVPAYVLPVTYADIAAGRTSPCPFAEQVENRNEKPMRVSVIKTVTQKALTKEVEQNSSPTEEPKVEEVVQEMSHIPQKIINEQHEESLSSIQNNEVSKTKDTNTISEIEVTECPKNLTASIEAEIEKPVTERRGRSPRRRDNTCKISNVAEIVSSPKLQVHETEVTVTRKQGKSENPQIIQQTPRKQQQIIPKETLKPVERRGRSPSPMWNPGSTSYADILRGRHDWGTESYHTPQDTAEFLQQEVLAQAAHVDAVPIVETVPVVEAVPVEPVSAVFDYIQQPPDLVGFIASGQQLLNSGLGTYHATAEQYIVPETSLEKPAEDFETVIVEQPVYEQEAEQTVSFNGKQSYDSEEFEMIEQPDDMEDNVNVLSHAPANPPEASEPAVETDIYYEIPASGSDATAAVTQKVDEEIQINENAESSVEIDRGQMSYAQIVAQGLCTKSLQPSSQTVPAYKSRRNDRSLSPRHMSPAGCYSREWSASPSRERFNTGRVESVRSHPPARSGSVPTSDTSLTKVSSESNQGKKGVFVDAKTNASLQQNVAAESKKPGRNKQKKKKVTGDIQMDNIAVQQIFFFPEVEDIDTSTNGEQNMDTATLEDQAVGIMSSTERKDVNTKKTNMRNTKSNAHSPQAPLIAEEILSNKENQAQNDSKIIGTEEAHKHHGDVTPSEQDKKKKHKKKKPEKQQNDDEIEKALKEIAEMEFLHIKHKGKKELLPEAKSEKEEKKNTKKSKLVSNNEGPETDPKQGSDGGIVPSEDVNITQESKTKKKPQNKTETVNYESQDTPRSKRRRGKKQVDNGNKTETASVSHLDNVESVVEITQTDDEINICHASSSVPVEVAQESVEGILTISDPDSKPGRNIEIQNNIAPQTKTASSRRRRGGPKTVNESSIPVLEPDAQSISSAPISMEADENIPLNDQAVKEIQDAIRETDDSNIDFEDNQPAQFPKNTHHGLSAKITKHTTTMLGETTVSDAATSPQKNEEKLLDSKGTEPSSETPPHVMEKLEVEHSKKSTRKSKKAKNLNNKDLNGHVNKPGIKSVDQTQFSHIETESQEPSNQNYNADKNICEVESSNLISNPENKITVEEKHSVDGKSTSEKLLSMSEEEDLSNVKSLVEDAEKVGETTKHKVSQKIMLMQTPGDRDATYMEVRKQPTMESEESILPASQEDEVVSVCSEIQTSGRTEADPMRMSDINLTTMTTQMVLRELISDEKTSHPIGGDKHVHEREVVSKLSDESNISSLIPSTEETTQNAESVSMTKKKKNKRIKQLKSGKIKISEELNIPFEKEVSPQQNQMNELKYEEAHGKSPGVMAGIISSDQTITDAGYKTGEEPVGQDSQKPSDMKSDDTIDIKKKNRSKRSKKTKSEETTLEHSESQGEDIVPTNRLLAGQEPLKGNISQEKIVTGSTSVGESSAQKPLSSKKNKKQKNKTTTSNVDNAPKEIVKGVPSEGISDTEVVTAIDKVDLEHTVESPELHAMQPIQGKFSDKIKETKLSDQKVSTELFICEERKMAEPIKDGMVDTIKLGSEAISIVQPVPLTELAVEENSSKEMKPSIGNESEKYIAATELKKIADDTVIETPEKTFSFQDTERPELMGIESGATNIVIQKEEKVDDFVPEQVKVLDFEAESKTDTSSDNLHENVFIEDKVKTNNEVMIETQDSQSDKQASEHPLKADTANTESIKDISSLPALAVQEEARTKKDTIEQENKIICGNITQVGDNAPEGNNLLAVVDDIEYKEPCPQIQDVLPTPERQQMKEEPSSQYQQAKWLDKSASQSEKDKPLETPKYSKKEEVQQESIQDDPDKLNKYGVTDKAINTSKKGKKSSKKDVKLKVLSDNDKDKTLPSIASVPAETPTFVEEIKSTGGMKSDLLPDVEQHADIEVKAEEPSKLEPILVDTVNEDSQIIKQKPSKKVKKVKIVSELKTDTSGVEQSIEAIPKSPISDSEHSAQEESVGKKKKAKKSKNKLPAEGGLKQKSETDTKIISDETATDVKKTTETPLQRRDTKKKLQRPTDILPQLQLEERTTKSSEAQDVAKQHSFFGAPSHRTSPFIPEVLTDLESVVLTPEWMAKSPPVRTVIESSVINITSHQQDNVTTVESPKDLTDESQNDKEDDSLLLLSSSTPPSSFNVFPQSPVSAESDSGIADELLSPRQEDVGDLGLNENAAIFGSVKERSRKPRKIVEITAPTDKHFEEEIKEQDVSVSVDSVEDQSSVEEDMKKIQQKLKKKKQRPKIPEEFISSSQNRVMMPAEFGESTVDRSKEIGILVTSEKSEVPASHSIEMKTVGDVQPNLTSVENSSLDVEVGHNGKQHSITDNVEDVNLHFQDANLEQKITVVTTSKFMSDISPSETPESPFNDAWINALDEPIVFDDSDEDKSKCVESYDEESSMNTQVSSTNQDTGKVAEEIFSLGTEDLAPDNAKKLEPTDEDLQQNRTDMVDKIPEDSKNDRSHYHQDLFSNDIPRNDTGTPKEMVRTEPKQEVYKEIISDRRGLLVTQDIQKTEITEFHSPPASNIERLQLQNNIEKSQELETVSISYETQDSDDKNIEKLKFISQDTWPIYHRYQESEAKWHLINAEHIKDEMEGDVKVKSVVISPKTEERPEFSDKKPVTLPSSKQDNETAPHLTKTLQYNIISMYEVEREWQESKSLKQGHCDYTSDVDHVNAGAEESKEGTRPYSDIKTNVIDQSAVHEHVKVRETEDAKSVDVKLKTIKHEGEVPASTDVQKINLMQKYTLECLAQERPWIDLQKFVDAERQWREVAAQKSLLSQIPACVTENVLREVIITEKPVETLKHDVSVERKAETKPVPSAQQSALENTADERLTREVIVTEKPVETLKHVSAERETETKPIPSAQHSALENVANERVWNDSLKLIQAEKQWKELDAMKVTPTLAVPDSTNLSERVVESKEIIMKPGKTLKQIFADGFEEFIPKSRTAGFISAEAEGTLISKESSTGTDEKPILEDNMPISECLDCTTLNMEIGDIDREEVHSTGLTHTLPGDDNKELVFYATLETQTDVSSGKSWADIVASKPEATTKMSTPLEEHTESTVCKPTTEKPAVAENTKLQVNATEQSISLPTIQIQPQEDDDTNLGEPAEKIDPDGFIEFVSKKELRRRRSRSRSASRSTRDVSKENSVVHSENENIHVSENVEEPSDKSKKLGAEIKISLVDVPDIPVEMKKDLKLEQRQVSIPSEEDSREETFSSTGDMINVKDKDKSKTKRERSRQRLAPTDKHRIRRDSSPKKHYSESEREVDEIVRVLQKEEILRQFIPLDETFWTNKWKFHDSEVQWQILLALSRSSLREQVSEAEAYNGDDHRRDDGGGSSGNSSPGSRTPRDVGGGGHPDVTTEVLSADLPGGVCSWPAETTYLSLEEHTSRLAHRVAEDVFTNLDEEPHISLAKDDWVSQLKASIVSDTENLQKKIEISEKELSNLPTDNLLNMLNSITKIIEDLEERDQDLTQLERLLRELPQDVECQTLTASLCGIRTHLLTLVSNAEQNRATVESAWQLQQRRQEEVKQYQILLSELEQWLNSAKAVLSADIQEAPAPVLREHISAHTVLSEELKLREAQLTELAQLCHNLQDYPDVHHLATVLFQQLSQMESAIREASEQINIRLGVLKESLIAEEQKPVHTSQEEQMPITPAALVPPLPQPSPVVEPDTHPEVVDEGFVLVSCPDFRDTATFPELILPSQRDDQFIGEEKLILSRERTDDTLNSDASSMPYEEVVLTTSVPYKDETTVLHAESQTGPSLLMDLSDKEPAEVLDRTVGKAQPVDMEIQTDLLSRVLTLKPDSDVAVQVQPIPSLDGVEKDSIKVSQKTEGNEETIEISTKKIEIPKPVSQVGDSDLLVQLKSKGRKGEESKDDIEPVSSELEITHTVPQSFETVVVEPGESTTEVIVDADGTKRVIVRKTHRTVVMRQHRDVIQEHPSTMLPTDRTAVPAAELISLPGITTDSQQKLPAKIEDFPEGPVTDYVLTSSSVVPVTETRVAGPIESQNIEVQVHSSEIPADLSRFASSSDTGRVPVVQHVTRKIIRRIRRRIIRKVVIINGKEQVTEEVIEEPEEIEVFEDGGPKIAIEGQSNDSVFIGEPTTDIHIQKEISYKVPAGTEVTATQLFLNVERSRGLPLNSEHEQQEVVHELPPEVPPKAPDADDKVEQLPEETQKPEPVFDTSYPVDKTTDETVVKSLAEPETSQSETIASEPKLVVGKETETHISQLEDDSLPEPLLHEPDHESSKEEDKSTPLPASTETSLAESTNITVSLTSSSGPSKMTEEEIIFLDSADSTHKVETDDTGYEAEDKTFDEPSLSGDGKKQIKKKKRRRKPKEKLKEPSSPDSVAAEEEEIKALVDTGTSDKIDNELQMKADMNGMLDRKGTKRKRDKKDDEEMMPEISMEEVEDYSPRTCLEDFLHAERGSAQMAMTVEETAVTDTAIDTLDPSEQLGETEPSKPLDKPEYIAEEPVHGTTMDITLKEAETPVESVADEVTVELKDHQIIPDQESVKTSELATQTVIAELTPTQEGEMQTSPDLFKMPLSETTETSAQTVADSVPVQEVSSQTERQLAGDQCVAEREALPDGKGDHLAATAEISMQTSPEPITVCDEESQTITEKSQPVESSEFSMQTVTKDLIPTQEGVVQTSPDLIEVTQVETAVTSVQTIVVPTQEISMQTLPHETADVQTQKDDLVPTQEGSVQTATDIPPEVSEMSCQTSADEGPTPPTNIIETETAELSVQTSEELMPVKEYSTQASGSELPMSENAEISVQTLQEEIAPVQDDSMQTTPVIEAETAEIHIQTNKEDLTPTVEKTMQTVTPELDTVVAPDTFEISVQTVKEETVPTTETSMQTVTPEPKHDHVVTVTATQQTSPDFTTITEITKPEEYEVSQPTTDSVEPLAELDVPVPPEESQTNKAQLSEVSVQAKIPESPEKFEVAVEAGEVIAVAEAFAQTSPEPVRNAEASAHTSKIHSPEKYEETSDLADSSSIDISEVSVQSNKDTPPTFGEMLQTCKPDSEEQHVTSPKVEETLQVSTSEVPLPVKFPTADLSTQLKFQDIVPTHEEFAQTSPFEAHKQMQEPLPLKETSMQTSPVQIRSSEESTSPTISDEPYEIQIQASITYTSSGLPTVETKMTKPGGSQSETVHDQESNITKESHEQKYTSDIGGYEQIYKQDSADQLDEMQYSPVKDVVSKKQYDDSLKKPHLFQQQIKTEDLAVVYSDEPETYLQSEDSKPLCLPSADTSKEILPLEAPGTSPTADESFAPTHEILVGADEKKKRKKTSRKQKESEKKEKEEELKSHVAEIISEDASVIKETGVPSSKDTVELPDTRERILKSGDEVSHENNGAFVKAKYTLPDQDVSSPVVKVIDDHEKSVTDSRGDSEPTSFIYAEQLLPTVSVPTSTDMIASEKGVNLLKSSTDSDTGSEKPKATVVPSTLQYSNLKETIESFPDITKDMLIDVTTVSLSDDRPLKHSELQQFIIEEKQKSSPKNKALSVVEDAKWKQASNLVVERVKNLQNARRTTHLSGMLCLASLHEVVAEESVEQRNTALQHNLNLLRTAAKSRDVIVIQRTVITTIETISTWLETVEYRVFLNRQKQAIASPTQEEIKKQFTTLKDEISTIEENVGELGNILEETEGICNEDDKARMKECVMSLQEQVKAVEEVAQETEERAAREHGRWEEFLNAVNNISVLVEELRNQVEEMSESDMPAREKLCQLDEAETMNQSHRERTSQLLLTARQLLRDFPGREIPPETYAAHETTRIIELAVACQRDKVLQQLALADEYEQTLREFAQITDVADALVENDTAVQDLNHLQEEMQKHRKFFVNLSHCRSILESLEGNLDSETRAAHHALHQSLHRRATAILDKAAARAQQMALAASRWTVLEQGMRDECGWLAVAQQRLPDLTAVTTSDFHQYISLFQSLAADCATHQARIAHLLETAQRLQELVTCVGLETRYDETVSVLLQLQDDVAANLRRLVTFREHWTTYDALATRLDNWIISADKELDQISNSTGALTGSMRQFWELKAQYELHNGLRSEAGNCFDAAMRTLPVADEMLQRQLHAQLEERWQRLSGRVITVRDAATRGIEDESVPLADRLAVLAGELKELRAALDDMHGVLRSPDELDLYIQRLQVMKERLDGIQEELGRLGLLSAEQSDMVGSLLGHARQLELQVSEELEAAEQVREQLRTVSRGLTRATTAQGRTADVLADCERVHDQGADVISRAIDRCIVAGQDLAQQWQQLMALRQQLHAIPSSRLRLSLSPQGVERQMSALQDTHAALEQQQGQLLQMLRARLALWQNFERRLETVRQQVAEAGYMMELLTVQGTVDLDRLVKATERLQGLSGSLEEREQLLTELHEAAAALSGTCAPEVSRQVAAAVEEAVASWQETRRSLGELCSRYRHAVDLWRRYRDASDAVRAWADQQLLEAADAPHVDADAVEASSSSLVAQQARLGELRELAARVAEAAGVEAGAVPLGAELAQLGRRLQEVRLAIDRLATAAEQRAAGRHELQAARAFLDSVHQSLAAVEEATEQDAEQQLGALRSHLLALGKTESQLQHLRGSAETSVDDVPVVEVLALWQQVFRETFQQYHRLSARLVRGQDGAAALRLWQEYLVHVQAFLSAGVPGDYKALAEHQHLCEVHQNLLTNQQNVLLSKNDSDGLLGSGLIESSVVEQFSSLTNLHNETLARIMDRHAEVRARLDAWDRYRQDQAVLLAWLRDTERERARLQLRYIHLRCLPKILLRIQALIEKIPTGEAQAESLQQQQSSLLTFCDEALATSIRMEHAAIVQRISNLGAALETWREFLERITNLAASFEQQAAAVTTAFNEVRSTIEQSGADTPVAVNAVTERLERLKELRTQLADRTADLETLGVTLEQLKECAAPQDMKAATQRVWLLWQAQADLEHQLTLLCHRLEERIGLRTLFDTRQSRFMTWASEVEARLERSSTADAEEVLRRLETELQAEVALKRREAEWLTRTGRELLAELDTNADPELQERVERVETRWRELQDLGRSRAARLAELLQTMSQLELRLAELRAWLHQVESKLATPLVFENCNKETVDQKLREHEELQKSIEKQSSNVGEVLNLCELLLTNCEACKATINTESITIATDMLEQRWKNVCGQSAERKRRIIAVCQLIQDLQKLCNEQEDWLTAQELVLKELDSQQDLRSQSEIQSFVSRIDGVLKEVESRAPALRILDQSYSRLHKESTLLEPDNMRQLTSGARTVLRRWHDLAPAAAAAQQRLYRELQRYRDFAAAHSRALVALTQFDISLTQAQHLTEQLDSAQLTQLETDLEALSPLVQEVEEVGNKVLQRCSSEETSELRGMLNECQLLWTDIRERFWQLREKCSSQVVDSAIQVETLRFEQDSAVQVDTLKLTSDDAYRYELESAMRECSLNLDHLEDVTSRTKITPRSTEISKALAAARSSIELVRHLSSLLPENRAAADRVRVLGERFDRMVANIQAREQQEKELSESTRLTCPLCSRRNWQQLDNDLWRLEQWLQYAEATQSAQSSPPNNIEKLEDTIQDHREFLMDLDSHKSIVVSLNIVGSHLADHTEDVEHAEQLRARLSTTNGRWDAVCRAAARWQAQLQVALMENSEFHHIIEELVEWLEKTENIIRQTEPVDLADDVTVIEAKYNKFRELRSDLERCEPRVMSLQEAADQLLRQPEEEGGVNTGSNTWARLTDLRLRLQSLRRLTGVYVLKLGAVLGREPSEMGTPVPSATAATSLASLPLELVNQTSSSQADVSLHGDQQQGSDTDMDTSVLTRGYRFLGRVIRASLPIQALMLLLLGVASLVPTGEEDYACNLSNTFARGLEPMLRYPNGPPPV